MKWKGEKKSLNKENISGGNLLFRIAHWGICVKQVNSECQTTLICDVWNQNTVCIMLLPAVENSK